MNFFNCQSFSSIQTYQSSSTNLIQLNTKSYSHQIFAARSRRAVSLEKEIQQNDWIPLSKQKMRRKSCLCRECGDLSKYQYKNMNVPNIPIKRTVKRQNSIRKQRNLTASTCMKQTTEKVRKLSGCKLSTTPRSPFSNFRKSTILLSTTTPMPTSHTQLNITNTSYQEPLSQISHKLQQITHPKPLDNNRKEKQHQFIIKINGQPIDDILNPIYDIPQPNVIRLPKESHSTKSIPVLHHIARSYLNKQNKGHQTHRQTLSMQQSKLMQLYKSP